MLAAILVIFLVYVFARCVCVIYSINVDGTTLNKLDYIKFVAYDFHLLLQ